MLSTRDVDLLVYIFEPFVEMLLRDLCTTFKKFLSTFEELHKTATKGASHHTFASTEEKLLIKKYKTDAKKGKPCPKTLADISSIALQKCKNVWLQNYKDSIYVRLLLHLGELYAVDVDGFQCFAKAFPLYKFKQHAPKKRKAGPEELTPMKTSTNTKPAKRAAAAPIT